MEMRIDTTHLIPNDDPQSFASRIKHNINNWIVHDLKPWRRCIVLSIITFMCTINTAILISSVIGIKDTQQTTSDLKEIAPDFALILNDLSQILPEIKHIHLIVNNICNSTEFSHICFP